MTAYEWSEGLQPTHTIRLPVFGKRHRLRAAVLRRDGWSCRYCRRRVFRFSELPGPLHLSIGLTYDHVVPKSKFGESTLANMVCCCSRCNNTKRDLDPEGRWFLPLAPRNPLPHIDFAVWARCFAPHEQVSYLPELALAG